MAKKTLHPTLKQRAQHVKAAHAHLTKTDPGFASLHPHERTRRVQQHVTKTLKGGY